MVNGVVGGGGKVANKADVKSPPLGCLDVNADLL